VLIVPEHQCSSIDDAASVDVRLAFAFVPFLCAVLLFPHCQCCGVHLFAGPNIQGCAHVPP